MRLIVCGGRNYGARNYVVGVLNDLHAVLGIRVLIHGAQSGADSLADEWALDHAVFRLWYAADWDRYGQAAGPIRNRLMLGQDPDLVLAFPGGKGTDDMVRQARRAGVWVIHG